MLIHRQQKHKELKDNILNKSKNYLNILMGCKNSV